MTAKLIVELHRQGDSAPTFGAQLRTYWRMGFFVSEQQNQR
jgi:hypothetical protein